MRRYGIASRWIVIGCLAAIGAVWAVTFERIHFEREDDVAQAVETNNELARAFEEHTARTFKVADQALRLLAYEFAREGASMPQGIFDAIARADPTVYTFMGIVDARGNLASGLGLAEGVDLSNRAYYAHHRDHIGGGLRVGQVAKGLITGEPEIQLSRRIEHADGTFAGVAVVGVDPAYFAKFYASIDDEPDGMVELVGLDGVSYARHSGSGAAGGQDMRGSRLLELARSEEAGSYVSLGRGDGVPRYLSFRVLREYGLVVAAGRSAAHVLAESNQRRTWYLLGASLATLFAVASCAGIVVALRRQQRAIEAARTGEALYKVTFDQAAVGISHHDLQGRFLRVNRKYCEIVGYSEAELRSMRFQDVLHPEDVPSDEVMSQLIRNGNLLVENRHISKDGQVRWVSVAVAAVREPSGRPDYLVAMVLDITERKAAEAQLERNAHYDALTGLPNRALLFDRLTVTLKHARRKNTMAGLLFVDLDRFKNVNDTLGHESGDLLLKDVAQRLLAAVRADDTVSRLGGDEFVIVLPELGNAQDAARVAQKVIDTTAAAFRIAEREVFVTASVGIAIFPGDGPDAETLINNADAAMMRAKQTGRNNLQFYTAALNARSAERLLLESDLRRALERREFILHFQPKASMLTGALEGFEALIRWKKTDGSVVPPGVFIPLLEESGLIIEVGNWVIRAACAQLREWQRAGFAPVPVAVNVAALQFVRTDLPALIEAATRQFDVEPRLLEIELTESAAMQDAERVVPVLQALRERGVTIAIDDFGTGYSSLAYLAKLPVQTLKVDRSFIVKMQTEANDLTLVSTMISLAHSLKMKVVAEGVESEEQAKLLRLLRCDQMQGFFYGKPMPAADCAALLKPARLPAAAPERVAA